MGASLSHAQVHATRFGGLRHLDDTVQLCYNEDDPEMESDTVNCLRQRHAEGVSVVLATEMQDEPHIVRRTTLRSDLTSAYVPPGEQLPLDLQTDGESGNRFGRGYTPARADDSKENNELSRSTKADAWDEVCLGFWRRASVEPMDGFSGECFGISVVRATTEDELQRMKPARATGVRVIVLTNAQASPLSTSVDDNPLYPTTPISGSQPTARTTVLQWLRERRAAAVAFARSVRDDPHTRDRIKEAAQVQLDRQVEVAKRLGDKLVSLEVVWRATAFVQRTLARKMDEAREWWDEYSKHK